jgi:hypothetical protein
MSLIKHNFSARNLGRHRQIGKSSWPDQFILPEFFIIEWSHFVEINHD